MLEIIKNRLPDVYNQEVLATFSKLQTGVTPQILDGFAAATARKDFEACFKALIEHNRQQ